MRARKSLADHALSGTKPQWTSPDPDVVSSRPKIPVEFPKGSSLRKLFKKYCHDLEKRRTLTSGDAELLRIAVLCRDRHSRAIGHVQTEGEIVSYDVVTKEGVVSVERPNLWMKIATDSEKQLVAILDRLGLTPANRSKIKQTEQPKPKDDAGEALLSREESARQKSAAEPEPDLDALLQTAEQIN